MIPADEEGTFTLTCGDMENIIYAVKVIANNHNFPELKKSRRLDKGLEFDELLNQLEDLHRVNNYPQLAQGTA